MNEHNDDILEEIFDRLDRIDDWTYKQFVWVRAAIIGLMVFAALVVLAALANA